VYPSSLEEEFYSSYDSYVILIIALVYLIIL